MFTSRAEYRLKLREDNADLRLTEVGRAMGLVDDVRWEAFSRKMEGVSLLQGQLKDLWIRPNTPEAKTLNSETGLQLARERRFTELLKMPEVKLHRLLELVAPQYATLDKQVIDQVEIQGKYAGYLDRQQADIDRSRAQLETRLPDSLDYNDVSGLSSEVRQKLIEHRPETIDQASRISGVTPAALSLLMVHLKKQSMRASA